MKKNTIALALIFASLGLLADPTPWDLSTQGSLNLTEGSTEYKVSTSDSFTDASITVAGGTHRIILDKISLECAAGTSGISVTGGQLTIELGGTSYNLIKVNDHCAIEVAEGAKLIVEGPGLLATALETPCGCSAVGFPKGAKGGEIVWNGGTFYLFAGGATMPDTLIGASEGTTGGSITINGGDFWSVLTNIGSYENGTVDSVTINGGAFSMANFTFGSYSFASKISADTVTVTGGSFAAFAMSGGPGEDTTYQYFATTPHSTPGGSDTLYKAVLPEVCDPEEMTEVSFNLTKDGTAYSSYSGIGHLFVFSEAMVAITANLNFQLPNGYYVAGDGSKNYCCTINNADNVFVEAPEPAFGLLALLALGLLGRSRK